MALLLAVLIAMAAARQWRWASDPPMAAALFLCLFLLPHPSLSLQFNVWPKPSSFSWLARPSYSPLSSSFSVVLHDGAPPPPPPPLTRATAYYARLIKSERYRPLLPFRPLPLSPEPISHLNVTVADPSVPLHFGVDEAYTLVVDRGRALLSAATPWGAIRGLETFSQLAFSASPVLVPCGLRVDDRPLFPHRGILLDTSRNFYPLRDIFRTIRAMAHNKLNVFHWHITDSQSFPLLLPSRPSLALAGSYGEAYRYSPDDVRRVVRYADKFGVRVVPEVDMPGHTGSWAPAFPDIVTCAGKFWVPSVSAWLAAEPGTGQLNPIHSSTYNVVRDVLSDVSKMFPDAFFHAGADEVNTACWEDDPSVRGFLANGGSHDQLLEIFVNKTHAFLADELNKTVVYWEDVLVGPLVKVQEGILPRETTVLQTWISTPKSVVSKGYRAIVSSSKFYYLDCGHGGWVGNDSRYDVQEGNDPFNGPGGDGGSWCSPFKSWQRVYDYDILHGLNEEEAQRVLGGEVALWSEQSDGTVLDAKLWPRAAAAAETLWSGNRDEHGMKRYAEAMDRLNEWRYRMVSRRIRAEPLQPMWCPLHPGMCNLVQ